MATIVKNRLRGARKLGLVRSGKLTFKEERVSPSKVFNGGIAKFMENTNNVTLS